MQILKKIDDICETFSKYGLVFSISLILVLSLANIFMRWFNLSCHWLDPLVRHLVFIGAFMGGALATGRRQHIGIDIVSKLLEQKNNVKMMKKVNLVISLVSFVTLAWLFKAGINMVNVEAEFGKVAFLGLHSAVLMAIIPFGFLIIGYRFLYIFLSGILNNEDC